MRNKSRWSLAVRVLLVFAVAGATLVPGPPAHADRYYSLVKNINKKAKPSDPIGLVSTGDGRVLFTAVHKDFGRELWTSDGTKKGTKMLVDFTPGPGSTNYGEIVHWGGWIYFVADGALWVLSPGSSVPQVQVDPVPGSASEPIQNLVVSGAWLFFRARTPDSGANHRIWATDGNLPAVNRILSNDILVGSNSNITPLHQGVVLFKGSEGGNSQLYRSNGTVSGTTLVEDIRPGDNFDFGFSLTGTLESGLTSGKLIFDGDDGVTGREPWVTDGTAAGTFLLKDLVPNAGASLPDDFVPYFSKVFFAANGPAGRELYATDGTTNGTELVGDINIGSSEPDQLVVNGGGVFFFATGDGVGRELWNWDAIYQEIQLVADITPGPAGSDFTSLTANEWTGDVLFGMDDGVHGDELWVSDGWTTTKLAADIRPGSKGSDPMLFTNSSNSTFFRADDGKKGTELHRYGSTILSIKGKPGIQVVEGDKGKTTVEVIVGLSRPSSTGIEFFYTFLPYLATPDEDYVNHSGNVTIKPGEKKKVIKLQIIGDKLDEPNEFVHFFASTSGPEAMFVGGSGVRSIEIVDDD